MRSQIVNRLRSNSTALNSVPPASTSNDYSNDLASLAARIIYLSPLPSQNDLPIFILNGAAFPDAKTADYDALLPYVLSRLPDDEELIRGHGYEVIFFAGSGGNAAVGKKARPGWQWYLQAYQVLTRVKRKKLQKLYIVHDKNFIRVLIELFASIVSPKFRKKIVRASTLSGLALQIPIENLLIPPSVYFADRQKSPDIYAPYASGRRAFGVQNPLPLSSKGSFRLPRILRETTRFIIMDDNIKVEGLFRVSARAQTVEVLKEAYDRGQKFIVWKEANMVSASGYYREGVGNVWVEDLDNAEGYELQVAAALIKLWYKELREPIFSPSSYQALEKYYGNPNVSPEVQQLLAMLSEDDEWSPISSKTSRHILKMHLLPLLSRVAAFHDRNQMSPENLAVCFAPSLICGPDPIEDLKISTIVRRILVAMVVHWESELAPLFGMSFETFEDSLRMPEAPQDREDALEEAGEKNSDETQSVGITLLDNDDSDAEMETLPALPPRPGASTAFGDTLEEANSLNVGTNSRTDTVNLDLPNGISPVRRKPSAVDNALLDNLSNIDIGAVSEAGLSDNALTDSTVPVRRKPAPALLPLPQYSSITRDRPTLAQEVRYYDTVPTEDDDEFGEEQQINDADSLPVYQARVPIYNGPLRTSLSPPPVAEPSIQRKPLPKPATWG